MRIPAWRVAITSSAITILAVAGISFAAASNGATQNPAAGTVPIVASDTATTDDLAIELAADVQSNDKLAPAAGPKLRRLLHLGRHLVHAEVAATDKDGNLVNLQLDHGTVQSIGDGTLVIAESGGGTETAATSDATKVHVGRAKGGLGDIKVGAEIFVQSRIDGGNVLAKRIIVIPAAAS